MGLEVNLVLDLNFIKFGVAAIGIVVKHDQRAHLRIGGELTYLG